MVSYDFVGCILTIDGCNLTIYDLAFCCWYVYGEILAPETKDHASPMKNILFGWKLKTCYCVVSSSKNSMLLAVVDKELLFFKKKGKKIIPQPEICASQLSQNLYGAAVSLFLSFSFFLKKPSRICFIIPVFLCATDEETKSPHLFLKCISLPVKANKPIFQPSFFFNQYLVQQTVTFHFHGCVLRFNLQSQLSKPIRSSGEAFANYFTVRNNLLLF